MILYAGPWYRIMRGPEDRGREYGVETPANARVVELMHAMVRGERRPGRDVFGDLGDRIRDA